MKAFRSLFAWWTDDARRARPSLVRGRRAPACESLEGRRLLGAGVGGSGWASWGGPGGTAPGSPLPADIHLMDATGAVQGGHAKGIEVMHSGAGIGKGGFVKFTASPQLKADFTTLENDMKTLQSEVPASLTATLKADQAVIAKALGATVPTTPKAGQPGDHDLHRQGFRRRRQHQSVGQHRLEARKGRCLVHPGHPDLDRLPDLPDHPQVPRPDPSNQDHRGPGGHRQGRRTVLRPRAWAGRPRRSGPDGLIPVGPDFSRSHPLRERGFLASGGHDELVGLTSGTGRKSLPGLTIGRSRSSPRRGTGP